MKYITEKKKRLVKRSLHATRCYANCTNKNIYIYIFFFCQLGGTPSLRTKIYMYLFSAIREEKIVYKFKRYFTSLLAHFYGLTSISC